MSELPKNALLHAAYAANSNAFPDMEGLIRDVYVRHLKKGNNALDVGVNHGVHLMQLASAVGPDGRVIGFEAAPELVRRTNSAIALHYPELEEIIEIHNVAVFDEPGEATFFFSKINDSGLSGLAYRAVLNNTDVEEITVPLRRLDDVLTDEFIAKLEFAKLDIEGAEYRALMGGKRVLERQPLLTFEWDKSALEAFNYKVHDLFDLVQGAGYRIYDLFGQTYFSAEDLGEAVTWNFLGIPGEMEPGVVLQPAFDAVKKQFPQVASVADATRSSIS